jgi:hypothetical protein
MAIGNRLFAQTDEAGARPILFAATQISPEPATSARTVCASSVAIQHWSAAAPQHQTWRWRSGCGHSLRSSLASSSHSRPRNPPSFSSGGTPCRGRGLDSLPPARGFVARRSVGSAPAALTRPRASREVRTPRARRANHPESEGG